MCWTVLSEATDLHLGSDRREDNLFGNHINHHSIGVDRPKATRPCFCLHQMRRQRTSCAGMIGAKFSMDSSY